MVFGSLVTGGAPVEAGLDAAGAGTDVYGLGRNTRNSSKVSPRPSAH
jgi:hypothetical protein